MSIFNAVWSLCIWRHIFTYSLIHLLVNRKLLKHTTWQQTVHSLCQNVTHLIVCVEMSAGFSIRTTTIRNRYTALATETGFDWYDTFQINNHGRIYIFSGKARFLIREYINFARSHFETWSPVSRYCCLRSKCSGLRYIQWLHFI